MRSSDRWLAVSAWSKNHRVPLGTSPGGEHVEYCQVGVDRLAVVRVQAESPVVARQDSDGLLEVVEGGAGQLGPGYAEVLEVHRRQRQRLSCAVDAQPLIAAVADPHRPGPLRQIPLLVASRPRQQVVGDPHAEVAAADELHDGGVVAGELL